MCSILLPIKEEMGKLLDDLIEEAMEWIHLSRLPFLVHVLALDRESEALLLEVVGT